MNQCWKELPDKRPNFSELLITISTILERIGGYLDFSASPLTPVGSSGSDYDHLIVTITDVDDDNQEQTHNSD